MVQQKTKNNVLSGELLDSLDAQWILPSAGCPGCPENTALIIVGSTVC